MRPVFTIGGVVAIDRRITPLSRRKSAACSRTTVRNATRLEMPPKRGGKSWTRPATTSQAVRLVAGVRVATVGRRLSDMVLGGREATAAVFLALSFGHPSLQSTVSGLLPFDMSGEAARWVGSGLPE